MDKNECEHPKEFVYPYKWHHGYGKYIEGLECRLCRARKGFKDQGYWTKYEDYISSDRGYIWEDQ